ncbi:hypothetical protein M8J77_024458 [Diaphorina citri]|nr:hypothetical protein M8J77_024458 [Diaphorina citri]
MVVCRQLNCSIEHWKCQMSNGKRFPATVTCVVGLIEPVQHCQYLVELLTYYDLKESRRSRIVEYYCKCKPALQLLTNDDEYDDTS